MAQPVAIFRFGNYTADIDSSFRNSIPPYFTVKNPGGGQNWQPEVERILKETSERALQEGVQITITVLNETTGTVQFVPDSAPAFEASFTVYLSNQPDR